MPQCNRMLKYNIMSTPVMYWLLCLWFCHVTPPRVCPHCQVLYVGRKQEHHFLSFCLLDWPSLSHSTMPVPGRHSVFCFLWVQDSYPLLRWSILRSFKSGPVSHFPSVGALKDILSCSQWSIFSPVRKTWGFWRGSSFVSHSFISFLRKKEAGIMQSV
jgi:hypothetical protein